MVFNTKSGSTEREILFQAVDTFDELINALLNQSKNVVKKRCTNIPNRTAIDEKLEEPEKPKKQKIEYEQQESSQQSSIQPIKPRKKRCKRCGNKFIRC